MSYPVLHADMSNITSNGLGMLSDCISCTCTHEPPGIWELRIEYPTNGVHADRIHPQLLLLTIVPYVRDPQVFRIYSVIDDLSGIMQIQARHISYDMAGIPVNPYTASNSTDAALFIKANSVLDSPFLVRSNYNSTAPFAIKHPRSARECLYGREGSLLDVYGGFISISNWTVTHSKTAGVDSGIAVRYGKNLTNYWQSDDISNFYTGVMPFWVDVDTDQVTTLPGGIVKAPGVSGEDRIKLLDCSMDFETEPTEKQLQDFASAYISKNRIGVRQISVSADCILGDGEQAGPYDLVTIYHPALQGPVTARVSRLVSNILLDRVDSISVGTVRKSLADSVADQQIAIDQLTGRG